MSGVRLRWWWMRFLRYSLPVDSTLHWRTDSLACGSKIEQKQALLYCTVLSVCVIYNLQYSPNTRGFRLRNKGETKRHRRPSESRRGRSRSLLPFNPPQGQPWHRLARSDTIPRQLYSNSDLCLFSSCLLSSSACHCAPSSHNACRLFRPR